MFLFSLCVCVRAFLSIFRYVRARLPIWLYGYDRVGTVSGSEQTSVTDGQSRPRSIGRDG